MSVINTNITSLIGQQNLKESQNALETSFERLSSGLRINSAKDDAAGQAIANRITAQVTGLSQAQRNANDGISVAQTAEGGLDQVNENLQRIRELSVQAENGTNSQADLNSIQAEIGQRLNEVNRISEETDFNGTKVLAKDQSLEIQVGANDNESISINLEKIDASSVNVSSFNVNGPQLEDGGTTDADALAAEFGDTTELENATASGGAPAATDYTAKLGLDNDPTLSGGADVIADDNGNFFFNQTLTVTDSGDKEQLENLGFEPNTVGGDNYEVYLSVNPDEGTVVGGTDLDFDVSLDDYDLGEVTGSNTVNPLETLDDALSQVDTLRSDLGAIQNRFESAITNLNTNETNLTAARSRIEDADFAVEVANQTKNQILQQAGTSALAQANQLPQNVLSLLG